MEEGGPKILDGQAFLAHCWRQASVSSVQQAAIAYCNYL